MFIVILLKSTNLNEENDYLSIPPYLDNQSEVTLLLLKFSSDTGIVYDAAFI